jgi:hypothetical protein
MSFRVTWIHVPRSWSLLRTNFLISFKAQPLFHIDNTNIKCTSLTLSEQFSSIKCTHTPVRLSPPSISRTLPSSQSETMYPLPISPSPQLLATYIPLSICMNYLLQVLHVSGIMQYWLFYVLLISPSMVSLLQLRKEYLIWCLDMMNRDALI